MSFLSLCTLWKIVSVVVDGGGTLGCCGEPMQLLKANTTDAAKEKHVPVVTVDGNKVVVNVGSVDHPMTPEHLINFIHDRNKPWKAVQGTYS